MEELLDEPGDVPTQGFVKFRTFPELLEAQILRARLESEHIRCFIPNENTLTINPLYIQALGGVQLWVHSADLHHAGVILDEIQSSPYTDENDSIIECPYCGSTHVESGYKSINSAGSLFSWLFALFTATCPIYARRKYKCRECNREFERGS